MSLVCVAIMVLSLLEQVAASCYNKNELTNQTYSTWTSSLSSPFGQPKEQDNNYSKIFLKVAVTPWPFKAESLEV